MGKEFEQTKPKVIQNTWWKDLKGRTWLIHSVWYNGGSPITITLLELGKSELIDQPYELIQDYVAKNTFKPITI